MTSSTFVILSFVLTHGIALLFAVRELLILRRPSPRGDDRPPPEPETPRGPRPLPDCLLPPRVPVVAQTLRARVLEDA